MPSSLSVRSRARVIGSVIAIVGLFVLHRVADGFIDEGAVLTSFRFSVLAIILAASVILVGLIASDLGRPTWAPPLGALGSVFIVLAFLPLLFGAFIALRGDAELAPFLFFAGVTVSMGVFLMVLTGQAKSEVDGARRRRRLRR